MKPSNNNLTPEEFVHLFVDDEDTAKHFRQLLHIIDTLREEICSLSNTIEDLESDIETLADHNIELQEKLEKLMELV